MEFKILQLNLTKKYDYFFMDYDYAKHNGVSLNDYKQVYKGNIEAHSKDIAAVLEEIFYKFNKALPQEFKGHSLSVSDVIELNNKFYYVDSFGFKLME